MNDLTKLIGPLVGGAVIFIILLATMGTIGSMRSVDNCWFRYNNDDNGDPVNTDKGHWVLSANGSYSEKPHAVKQWVNTHIAPVGTDGIRVKIQGTLSLCKAYLPKFNLESDDNTDPSDPEKDPKKRKAFEIPRIEDGAPPISLYFDATNPKWRNIAQVDKGDQVVISLTPEYKDKIDKATGQIIPAKTIAFTDLFTKETLLKDCSDGQRTYHPICGKYSIHKGQYVTGCELKPAPKISQTNPSNLDEEELKSDSQQDSGLAVDTAKHFYKYETPMPTPRPARCIDHTPYKEINETEFNNLAQQGLGYLLCGEQYAEADRNYYLVADMNKIGSPDIPCAMFEGSKKLATNELQDFVNLAVNYRYICLEDGYFYAKARHATHFDNSILPNNDNHTCQKLAGGAKYRIPLSRAQYIASSYPDYNRYLCHRTSTESSYVPINPGGLIWSDVYSEMPEAYKSDGSYTYPHPIDLKSINNYDFKCTNGPPTYIPKDKDFIMGAVGLPGYPHSYATYKKFWYSSNDASGLLYRFDTIEQPTNETVQGGTINFAAVAEDQSYYRGQNQIIIYNEEYKGNIAHAWLQYRFIQTDGLFANDTGGYILNVKQTKCRCKNGKSLTDPGITDGKVEYILTGPNEDPNSIPPTSTYLLDVDDKGEGKLVLPQDAKKDSIVWLRISNSRPPEESNGWYDVQFTVMTKMSKFSARIVRPLLLAFKTKLLNGGTTVFQNMVCYKSSPDANCTDFFNYIKGMLTLYVITYASMFMIGMQKIDQKSVVVALIKIIIIAGLLNKSTFEFFKDNIIPSIMNFSDEIISNIGGYKGYTDSNGISNPFMYMDTLMTNMLFSNVFFLQVLAMLAMGLSGVLYFIIVLLAICIMLICALRAIAVYLMAYMALTLLIAIAPIFLTFMLFENTRYLFDNWIKATVRYMVEPTIMMVGVIILTQLFTIYIDFILGYSVCWKCAVPFKLPFPSMAGLANSALANIDIFCINWYAPWGLDHRSGMMGVDLSHMAALIIIVYCLYGYIELSSQIVSKLVGGMGPSATSMGNAMSSNIENKALGQIGLDKSGRDNIQKGIKDRLKLRKKGETQEDDTDTKDKKKDKTKSNNSTGSSGRSGPNNNPTI